MEETKPKSRLRPRRIIERPRLTRILDGSSAQVRMLIAPPGYGKTTLAEQWTSAEGRRVAWYPCRPSSADVAVLSVGVAQAAIDLIPGADRRIRERLRATRNPPAEVEPLAELVAEDFAEWPADAWLVIDDYQHVCGVPEAEYFVELLVERSPINLLLASRQRPAWVSRRAVLYGDVLEVGRVDLAMISDEAEEVLGQEEAVPSTGLISLADGWPAVLGLAGLLDVNGLLAGDPPESLYEYFADEVFRDLDDDVRSGLALLSVPPVLNRTLVNTLLGPAASHVLADATAVGLVASRGTGLEVQPLARTFLLANRSYAEPEERRIALTTSLAHYRATREWDAVLELVEQHDLHSERAPLLEEALESLLEEAKITTIEIWATRRSGVPYDDAVSDIARGEVCLRQGHYAPARVFAEQSLGVVPETSSMHFRALKLAGQAEHVSGREDLALELFRRAERVARTDAQRRDAKWAQLMSCVASELDEARGLLAELEMTVSPDNPSELVRLSGRRICFDLIFESVDSLDHAREAEQLLPHVADPFLRGAFMSPYATGLVLSARYQEGLRVASRLIHDAQEHSLELMLPAAFTAKGLALAGIRDFVAAHECLNEATERARRSTDTFAEQNAYAGRMRVLAQEQRFHEATAIEPPSVRHALPSMQGEVSGSRGLVFACLGMVQVASRSAEVARRVTRSLEASTLAAAVDSIVAVESGAPNALALAELLVDRAFECGTVDTLVTSYRASPALLSLLLRLPSAAERLLFALKRSCDEGLAELGGQPVSSMLDPSQALSAREREICELVAEGLSNRDIARLLFISEATVKAHVHHVFDKLGVHSRQALALRALRMRGTQAPIATGDTSDSNGA